MATRPPVDQSLLSDLVATHVELPEVEYKRWMLLSGNEERAKIARHICAIANSGGGYLVFGFEDDGAPSEPHPGDLSGYDQDTINGIAARYLRPVPHCEVHVVTAKSGRSYPIVRVPSHDQQPVCAKRDGPSDQKGRPVGRLHALASDKQEGPARALLARLREAYLPEKYKDVSEEIARIYELVPEKPQHNRDWVFEMESSAILLEAA